MVIRTTSRAPAEVVFLMEGSPEPLIVMDLDHRIAAANCACPRRAALRSRQSGRVVLERALARHGRNWKAQGVSERMLYRKLRAHGFNGPGNGSRSRGTEPTP